MIRPKKTCKCCGPIWRKYVRPLAFYTDKASHFQTSEKRKRDEPGVEKDAVEMPPTQIGRALRELGITWIPAHLRRRKTGGAEFRNGPGSAGEGHAGGRGENRRASQ